MIMRVVTLLNITIRETYVFSVVYAMYVTTHEMSRTTRGYYVFGNQQLNRKHIKIDWHDVFRDCKIHVPDSLKDWLIKYYTPPRKVRSN